MILLLWQDQYIFNTNPFSWVLGANIGRWCAWLHACSSNDESEHFDRSSLFVQKTSKSRESGLLQTVERYLTERWQRILIFYKHLFGNISIFFYPTFQKPSGSTSHLLWSRYHRLRQKLVKKIDDKRKVMACFTEWLYGK